MSNIKFKHIRYTSSILTICSRWEPEHRRLTVGYAICQPKDRFVKKIGNALAQERCEQQLLQAIIPDYFPIIYQTLDWVSANLIARDCINSQFNCRISAQSLNDVIEILFDFNKTFKTELKRQFANKLKQDIHDFYELNHLI